MSEYSPPSTLGSYQENSDIDYDSCLLCEKGVKSSDFPNIISKALERKYCQNLNNFYYQKDIKSLLEGHA